MMKLSGTNNIVTPAFYAIDILRHLSGETPFGQFKRQYHAPNAYLGMKHNGFHGI